MTSGLAATLLGWLSTAGTATADCRAELATADEHRQKHELKAAEDVYYSVLSAKDQPRSCLVAAYEAMTYACMSHKQSAEFMACAERLLPVAARVETLDTTAWVVMTRLAGRYESAQRYDEAETLWRQMLTLSDEATRGGAAPSTPELRSTVFQRLGLAARRRGDLKTAKSYFEQALSEFPKDDLNFMTASDLLNLGRIHLELREYQSAVEVLERAVRASEASWGHDSRSVADALAEYAKALLALGRKHDAQVAQERAAAIRARIDTEG